jgi:hypothetical protein
MLENKNFSSKLENKRNRLSPEAGVGLGEGREPS